MNKFSLLALGLTALLGASLSACAKPSTEPATKQATQRQAMREGFYELNELDLSKVGLAKQIALDDVGYLLLINDKGELWQVSHPDRPAKLAENVSPSVAPVAKFDKVAFADKDGHFTLIE